VVLQVTVGTRAPDCVARKVLLINGQFQPRFTFTQGDWVEVRQQLLAGDSGKAVATQAAPTPNPCMQTALSAGTASAEPQPGQRKTSRGLLGICARLQPHQHWARKEHGQHCVRPLAAVLNAGLLAVLRR
jgi:hypothetical protein